MTDAADEHQRLLFETVIEAISNDKFVDFMERYASQICSPSSPKFLNWLQDQDDEEYDLPESSAGTAASSGCPIERGGNITASSHNRHRHSGLLEYSQKHFDAFQTYKLFFESKLRACLKKFGSEWTDEKFFGLCEQVLLSSSGDENTSSDKTATSFELCTALLGMLDAASEFGSFCEMMARVQAGLVSDDAEDDGVVEA